MIARWLSLAFVLVASSLFAAEPPKLNVLFLGDNAGHKPTDRFHQLQPELAKRNILLTYTDKVSDLNTET